MSIMQHILIGTLLTLANVGAILYVILQYVPRKMRTFSERLERWHDIENACNALITDSTVQRALVLRLTNGGGEPLPGRTYYATVVVSAVDETRKRHATDYNKIEVDETYISMIIRLRHEKRLQILTSALPVGSLLKSLYDSEGVKFSEVHYLASTLDATYYISFATYDETHLQPSWGAIMKCVSDVRGLLRRAYPGVK